MVFTEQQPRHESVTLKGIKVKAKTNIEEQTARELLREVRLHGFYLPKSELEELIQKHAPTTRKPTDTIGKALGKVGKNLQTIWALSGFFMEVEREHYVANGAVEVEGMLTLDQENTSAELKVRLITLHELFLLCRDAFWDLLRSRLADKITINTSIALDHNWDVYLMSPSRAVPKEWIPLNVLLDRVCGQLTAYNSANE